MYFVALATDYDGALAEDGLVAEETTAALRSFRQSGRELPDLRSVFQHLDLFDAAVVENRACSRIKETVERRYTKPA
jgi:hydroxymethylpyrimidine pyrophosphatase-like HAD family hydrolase